MNAISFFISVFDIFLTICCHIWDTSGVRAVLMPSLSLSSSLIPSLLFFLSLSFSLLVSVVSKWHTEATTLAATYKKIFIAPTAANIYHTLVCVLCASVSVCWCVCVCVMVCVYCASFAGHYLYSANLPPCDYCDWLPFWLLLSRFARLSCFPSPSFPRSLSLCHTLSFCWWHSSCTFALASCALHTVLHFIVYCGCPTRLSAWHSPTWHCSRRRL